ncbi:TetR/AcrR family transcriptional regulator [Nocardioides marmoraquaticus]
MDQATVSRDGRNLRKQRNIDHVLDALESLTAEGLVDVSPEELSNRSGLSLRSLYRYFPNREELLIAAVRRQRRTWDHLYAVAPTEPRTLEHRIGAHVSRALERREKVSALAHVARFAAAGMPRLRTEMQKQQAELLSGVRAEFSPELSQLDEIRQRQVALAIQVMSQLESIDSLLGEVGLSEAEARVVLRSSITALLR